MSAHQNVKDYATERIEPFAPVGAVRALDGVALDLDDAPPVEAGQSAHGPGFKASEPVSKLGARPARAVLGARQLNDDPPLDRPALLVGCVS